MKLGINSVLSKIPPYPDFEPNIRRAPSRGFSLNKEQTKIALRNALRYLPKKHHEAIAPEFLEELHTYGRIYAYRYRPPGDIKPKPIDQYKGNCVEGKAFQLMIDNNLSFDIALYPYELITYGETGAVCGNWMQYRLIKAYLENLTENHTLVVQSGHPLGLFPSVPSSPRVIITNGLMINMFDRQDFELACQMGVTGYGQMTAGGWMYIGPQGIVHGTFNTILNAARIKLGQENLAGTLFVSSGLGGMSGAQPKAVEIGGGVGIIAEVDPSRVHTRLSQGWVSAADEDLTVVFTMALEALKEKRPFSVAYQGNIITLLEYAVNNNIKIDLLTDQTSCHDVYQGGYCPEGITFEKRTELLKTNPAKFKELVNLSLHKHFSLVKTLADRGTYFFDYGNSFLKAVYDGGIKNVAKNGSPQEGFIFPSYVEDIMGPLFFDFGYGPFRWVCLSMKDEDLLLTDKVALEEIDQSRSQDRDNYMWLKDAHKNNLVVGSKARILYQNAEGRKRIALRFNQLVREGKVGPIMLGRDHHDVSGADSPFRETANIKDGSNVTADMVTQCFAGNAARGMSLIALHNGGGVGINKSINGGFGLVLDGSPQKDKVIEQALMWDVMGGIARRSWATNENALKTAANYNKNSEGYITLPNVADDGLVDYLLHQAMEK